MRRTGILIVLVFAGLIGLALLHPFGNSRVAPRQGLDTLLHDPDIPVEARRVLVRKCADCHSNETRWPVYAHVAPGSWLIERDIEQARGKMNLSHWSELTTDDHEVLIAKILHESKEGDMPPLQYRVFHWGARMTPTDLEALRSMSKTIRGEADTSASTGDAARGKLVFQRRCTGCHAIDADREGPRLAGVFGRKAGGVPSFEYSAGLKNSGLTWNETTLERWLADPDLVVPETKMDFRVPKAQERTNLIAYFKH